MSRVVILWKRPYRLSDEGAQDWAREQVSRILHANTVRSAVLTPVRGGWGRLPSDCDWMLDVRLGPGRNAQDFVDDPAAAAWLGDLQQLGLQPRVMVLNGGLLIRPERR